MSKSDESFECKLNSNFHPKKSWIHSPETLGIVTYTSSSDSAPHLKRNHTKHPKRSPQPFDSLPGQKLDEGWLDEIYYIKGIWCGEILQKQVLLGESKKSGLGVSQRGGWKLCSGERRCWNGGAIGPKSWGLNHIVGFRRLTGFRRFLRRRRRRRLVFGWRDPLAVRDSSAKSCGNTASTH